MRGTKGENVVAHYLSRTFCYYWCKGKREKEIQKGIEIVEKNKLSTVLYLYCILY